MPIITEQRTSLVYRCASSRMSFRSGNVVKNSQHLAGTNTWHCMVLVGTDYRKGDFFLVSIIKVHAAALGGLLKFWLLQGQFRASSTFTWPFLCG